MPWIESRKTKKGERFYLYWYQNGKRKSRPCGFRKSLAIESRNKKEEELLRKASNLVNPNLTVSELADEYERHGKEDKRPNTIKHIAYGLKKLKDYMGTRSVVKIGAEDIEAFRKHLIAKEHNINGVNIIMNPVIACFQYAVKQDYIYKNPAKGMKYKPVRVARYLTPAEITTLKEIGCEFNPDLKRIINIALYTGMRIGEIAALRREHIRNGFIHIEKNKTDTPRLVPIHPEITQDIKNLSLGRWSRNRIERAFTRAVKRSGIESVRFHDLRHTFCSRYLQSGGTIADLKEISGHKTLQALEIYTHFQPSFLKERIANLSYQ
jgi:integrase